MENLKYNAEGYLDPTAYMAISKINNFRPVVYICSPYAGDTKTNIEKARDYCRIASKRGYIPIAVHLLFPQFLDDKNLEERELGMFFGNVIMSKCAEVWVCGEIISQGMEAEIKRAKRKGYTIRYFDNNMKEVNLDA